jgi:hypothetical protein
LLRSRGLPATSFRIGFATHDGSRGSSEDDRLALPELRSLGIDTVPIVWNDPTATWTELSAVVLRSTWDYPLRFPEFLAWIDRIAHQVQVWN